ncbi:MAG: glycosyltransferase [Akkermansiaceae bacterium]|nr:glycosyltransferase [Akkermansiaceae bacterium]
MRILISAFYCSPYRGSESAVGWQIATGVARSHDVTVLCGDLSPERPTFRDLERYKSESGLPKGLTIEYIAPSRWMSFLNRFHRLPGMWTLFYMAYRLWQRKAYRKALTLHAERPFDLAHQTTVIGFREPGFLWKLPVPFLWGPVSGAPVVPFSFINRFGVGERFRWGTHLILNRLQITLARNARLAARKATRLWAVTPEDLNMFRNWGIEPFPLLETAGPNELSGKVRTRSPGSPLRICWSGLFQGRKCLFILLEAIGRLQNLPLEIEILGDGPEAERWKNLASRLNLGERVHWNGMIPRQAALRVMESCHVFAHTSVKEASSTVTLEALAMGLPVICHDACGMGTAVNSQSGIKVPLLNPACSVEGFQRAIQRFSDEPALLGELSVGALNRARELSWEVKIGEILQGYEEVLAKTC